jgi:hypothetical protein
MTISTAVRAVPGFDRWWISAPLAGVGLGVLTNLAQGRLPGAWNQIANSGAVWCVPAFVAGALVAGQMMALRKSALAGVCTTIGLVIGYYGYAEFGLHGTPRPHPAPAGTSTQGARTDVARVATSLGARIRRDRTAAAARIVVSRPSHISKATVTGA